MLWQWLPGRCSIVTLSDNAHVVAPWAPTGNVCGHLMLRYKNLWDLPWWLLPWLASTHGALASVLQLAGVLPPRQGSSPSCMLRKLKENLSCLPVSTWPFCSSAHRLLPPSSVGEEQFSGLGGRAGKKCDRWLLCLQLVRDTFLGISRCGQEALGLWFKVCIAHGQAKLRWWKVLDSFSEGRGNTSCEESFQI